VLNEDDPSLLSLPGSDIDITFSHDEDGMSTSANTTPATTDTEATPNIVQAKPPIIISAPTPPEMQRPSILRNVMDVLRRSSRNRKSTRRYPE
jgi:hypothetical protein